MSKAVVDALSKKFGDKILSTSNDFGDESVSVAAKTLHDVCAFLKEDAKMAFDVPVMMTCVDWLGLRAEGPRFELVVQLRSLEHGHRIRIKVPLEEKSVKVPSLADLWVGFNWLERETYDMYGVQFEKHPDLRRIYLYEEFEGYPLRKDYYKDHHQPLARRDWADE